MNGQAIRAAIISLGCAKNLVDSEVMVGVLLSSGIDVVSDPAHADVVIINTCSFIGDAKAESIDTIFECLTLRDSERPTQAVVVVGCLPQRYQKDLGDLIPQVELLAGTHEIGRIADLVARAVSLRAERLQHQQVAARNRHELKPIHPQGGRQPGPATSNGSELCGLTEPGPIVAVTPRPTYIHDAKTPRLLLTPAHYAYVKISEGCSHRCSFCVIPRVRGPQRSRSPDDIISEAKMLVRQGVKELNLIAQDSTAYGRDLVRRPTADKNTKSKDESEVPTLSLLVRKLQAIPGDFWIRILYTHPAHWTDELIETIASSSKVVKYVDIPIQHANRLILHRMRRETEPDHLRRLLSKIRSCIPGVAIRTTVIVGFPGETETCFAELLDFIREQRFERLGVFTYSQEEGTMAARMTNQVPEQEKQRRMRTLLMEQRKISRQVLSAFVGRKIRVLIDGRAESETIHGTGQATLEHGTSRISTTLKRVFAADKWLVGRSEIDAPDIDGRVYVRGNCRPGQFAKVRVVGYTNYDLIAELDGT